MQELPSDLIREIRYPRHNFVKFDDRILVVVPAA